MKREKIFDAVTGIRDDIITRVDTYEAGRRPRRRWWISAVAAVLVVAVALGIFLRPGGVLVGSAYAIAQPEYPDMAHYPTMGGLVGYDAWREDVMAQRGPEGYADGLEDYFARSISTFLSGTEGENRVYSPVNVYMALAMLAEMSAGDSREQILTLLGHESIDSLRRQAHTLWNANYRDDGATASVLASSVWLKEGVEYVQSTMDTLADSYYASSFRGEMGSAACDKALQNWLNEQTGGLLKQQAEGVRLSPETVLALATTVYFSAKWDDQFREENTRKQTFHAEGGDVTCDFMHSRLNQMYAWGEIFSAVQVRLENAGSMYLILPDEGYTVDDLLKNEQAMAFALSNGEWEDSKYLMVNLSMPKFDVSSEFDLKDGLWQMGVSDVFDEFAADFSPAVVTDEAVWVDSASHAARVMVDEEGCKAAAYTVMRLAGSAAPPDDEVDFVLDRPFLFVLTGIDGLPLFTGVVNHPV